MRREGERGRLPRSRPRLDEPGCGGGHSVGVSFDSIPHAELMKSVSRRISDGRVLRLLKMWLEAPAEETDGKGDRHRTTRNKDQGIGSPQGSPISPLIANIYMRRFVKGWKTGGHEERLEARIVNYADDCAPGNVCSR